MHHSSGHAPGYLRVVRSNTMGVDAIWMSWLALADIIVLILVMGLHASMRRDGTYWWNPPTKDWKESDG